MKNFFMRLIQRIQVFMYGRYGYDELYKVILISAFVCTLLIFISPWFNVVAWLLLFWGAFRVLSKNITKRQAELYKYNRLKDKVKKSHSRRKNMFRERKTHKYFKCKCCKTYLRVPKGKGKIVISCPKCRNSITKRT